MDTVSNDKHSAKRTESKEKLLKLRGGGGGGKLGSGTLICDTSTKIGYFRAKRIQIYSI